MRAEIITLRDGEPSQSTVASGITGVVLADGCDERFAGRDRGLLQVAGRPLIKRVLEQLVLQVKQIVIVARDNQSLYAAYGYRVIPDPKALGRDPLPAIVSALGAIETTHALFVPADAARLPLDLGTRLWQAYSERADRPCFVRAGDRSIPCLVAKSERSSAEQALTAGRTLREWLVSRAAVEVDFSAWPPALRGIASPSEIASVEAALRR